MDAVVGREKRDGHAAVANGRRVNQTQTLDGLAIVMAHATAPAFLLGAIAAYISVVVARLHSVIERSRAIADDDAKRVCAPLLFTGSLVFMAKEVSIGLTDADHRG